MVKRTTTRSTASPQRSPARKSAVAVAVILGVYLILRAIAEPFAIDLTEPASYQDDWGGPSLAGVLAVHMLPGAISLTLLILWARRKGIAKRAAAHKDPTS